MERDSGIRLERLAVDGGMSNSDECMQLQADIMGIDIDRPAMRETTALGAALAAGYGIGIWGDFHELQGINTESRSLFRPTTSEAAREKLFKNWERAVDRAKGWVSDENDFEE